MDVYPFYRQYILGKCGMGGEKGRVTDLGVKTAYSEMSSGDINVLTEVVVVKKIWLNGGRCVAQSIVMAPYPKAERCILKLKKKNNNEYVFEYIQYVFESVGAY